MYIPVCTWTHRQAGTIHVHVHVACKLQLLPLTLQNLTSEMHGIVGASVSEFRHVHMHGVYAGQDR